MSDALVKKSSRRRWLRRVLLGLGALLVTALIGVAVLLVYLSTDAGKEFVRKRAEAALQDALVGGGSIGRIEGSVFGDLVIRDLVINDATGQPAIEVARAEVEFQILPLLSGSVQIDRLTLNGLAVTVRNTAEGEINLAALTVKKEDDDDDEDTEPGGSVLEIKNLTITDGTVAVALDEMSPETIENITVASSHLRIEGASIAASLGQTTAHLLERDIDVAVRSAVTLEGEDTAIEDLVLEVAGAKLAISSAVIAGADPREAVGSISVPAASIARLLPSSQLLADTELAISTNADGIHLDGVVGSSPVAVTALLTPSRGEYKATVDVGAANLAAIWTGLPRSMLSVNAIATHTAGGSTITVNGSGDLEGKTIKSVALEATRALEGELQNVEVTATAASSDGNLDASAVVSLGERVVVQQSRVAFDSNNLRSLLAPWMDVRGDLRANLTATGPLETLAVKGSIRSRSLAGFGARVSGLTVRPDVVRLDHTARGNVVVETRSLTVGETALDGIKLTASSADGRNARVAVSGTGTAVAFDGRADVDITPEKISARLRSASGRYQRLEADSDGGLITWTPSTKQLEVDNVTIVTNAGELSASARLTMGQRIRGKASIEAGAINVARLQTLAGLEPTLGGTASLRASIDTSRRTKAELALNAYSVALPGELPVASAAVQATLRGRELVVISTVNMQGTAEAKAEVHVRAPSDPFDSRGWARLDRRAVSYALASAEIANIAPFTHLHPEIPRRGELVITASQKKGDTALELRAAGKGLTSARVDELSEIDLTALLDGDKVAASGSVAVGNRANLSFAATAGLRGPWFVPTSYQALGLDAFRDATLEASDIDVDWWTERYAPDVQPSGGRARVLLTYVPSSKSLEMETTLELPRGTVRERTIAQATTLKATLKERAIDAELGASFAGTPRLDGAGSIAYGWRDALEGNKDPLAAKAKGRLAIKKLPLVHLREVTRTTPIASDAPLAGTLSATASFSGTVLKPELAANASVDGAVIADVAFASLLAGGSYRDGKIDVTATGDQDGGGRLVLRAGTDLDGGETAPVSGAIVADKFDLSFLRELMPQRAIGGFLTADIRTSGTQLKPILTGKALLEKGSFNPGAPLYRLRDAKLTADLSEDKAIIKGTARSGRGKVTFDANVGFVQNKPQSLAVELVTQKLPLDTGLIVRIDSTTTLRGQRRDRKWQMVATVDEAIVNIPDELSRSLHPTSLPSDIVFASDEEAVAARSLPPIPTEIALSLRADDTILVRGGIANAVIGAKLDVKIREDVRVDGTVRVEQGWLELIGRRYDVRTGEVSFDGRLDPALNIELAHEFTSMTLFVDVGGVASNPVVEFRSDPSQYDDSELLSFVLGGNPDEPTSDDRSVANRATGVATSYLASQLSGVVTQVTPIDVLRIDTDDKSADRVALGKWLTAKLLVAYRHRFAADPQENTGELTFEYRFLKRWLLEGYVGQLESGADVLWIRRF